MFLLNFQTKICQIFGVRYPIIQGGMGVLVSNWRLVSAVANCGGMGTLAGAGLTPSKLIEEITKTRKNTKGVFGVNLMTVQKEFSELLQVCIQSKVDFVTLGVLDSQEMPQGLSRKIISFLLYLSPRSKQQSWQFDLVPQELLLRLQVQLEDT